MSHEHLNPLVDSDYIVYAVGFAASDDEPLENVLHSAKLMLFNIWDRFPNREYHKIFLSGKNNFRDKLATIKIYKGNRDPSHRPKFYSEIKEYLVNIHKAEIVNGMEAEDACGIQQYSCKDKSTVIVGVDKDLLTVPGYHYNPKKDILHYVSLAGANYNFWNQVLQGDRVDNIRGIDGVGPKKAEKLLSLCNKDELLMQQAVLKEYERQHGDDALRCMDETAKLIYILRKEGLHYDGTEI